MVSAFDRHLEEMERRGETDRRNGCCHRWLMMEHREIDLSAPCTRRYGALGAIRAYSRPAGHFNRMILALADLGLSTHKVTVAFLPVLDQRISAGTVSQVTKSLDATVTAFHRWPLKDN